MHIASIPLILIAASLVAAQTSNIPESGCGHAIDLIIQACLRLEEPQLQACAVSDWNCLCSQAGSVRSCYDNCPADPNGFGTSQTEVSYCNAAKVYPSSSSSATATTIPVGFALTGNGGTSTTPSPTSLATVLPPANAAGDNRSAPLGGLLAAFFGLALM